MAYQAAKIISDWIKATRLKASQRLELGIEVFTGAGAVSVVTPVTMVVSTSTDALTLANGYEGQVKIIIHKTDGGTATVTPASMANGTSFAMAEVNDAWVGIFHAAEWHTIVLTGIAIS